MVAARVRQVVVLYSNDCMGICLGLLSIARLRRVVVLKRRSFELVLTAVTVSLPFYQMFSILHPDKVVFCCKP